MNQLDFRLFEILWVITLVGLSDSIGRGAVLFINKVKPGRFILTLAFFSLIFIFSFLIQAVYVWLALGFFLEIETSFLKILTLLSYSYIPFILSFLAAIPFFGVFIYYLLAFWSLGILTVILQTNYGLNFHRSLVIVIGGWLFYLVLQLTAWKPFSLINQTIMRIITGNSEFLATWKAISTKINLHKNLEKFSHWFENHLESSGRFSVLKTSPTNEFSTRLKVIFGIILCFLGVVGLFASFRFFYSATYAGQSLIGWLFFQFFWVMLSVFLMFGLLAPVEALAWWAGWFKDSSAINPENKIKKSFQKNRNIKRYIIFLNGIGQVNHDYEPETKLFLSKLKNSLGCEYKIIEGLMSYSVVNQPLSQQRPLSFLWRWVEKHKIRKPKSFIGRIVNIRNVWVVAVCSDSRYKEIYSQPISISVVKNLLEQGYNPDKPVPITLLCQSGGSQIALTLAPYLKKIFKTPIEVISLGGIMSGNNNLSDVQHLYNLVGDKDYICKLSDFIFINKWPIFFLSNWNRQLRRQKITKISLGKVGHILPEGMLDPNFRLENGKTALENTLSIVKSIITSDLDEKLLIKNFSSTKTLNNYKLFLKTEKLKFRGLNYTFFPDNRKFFWVNGWCGRLILPKIKQRNNTFEGVYFEIFSAPLNYSKFIGKKLILNFKKNTQTKDFLNQTLKDVHFTQTAKITFKKGYVHPVRLEGLKNIDPLQSLAGSREQDDIIVGFKAEELEPVEEGKHLVLKTESMPVEISGWIKCLVKFKHKLPGSLNEYRAEIYDSKAKRFLPSDIIFELPKLTKDIKGCTPQGKIDYCAMSENLTGFYLTGAFTQEQKFRVFSAAPSKMMEIKKEYSVQKTFLSGKKRGKKIWKSLIEDGCRLINEIHIFNSNSKLLLQEGQEYPLLALFGGYDTKFTTPWRYYFSGEKSGHFSFGKALVKKCEITGKLVWNITYYQLYAHYLSGIISGKISFEKFVADRQWGILGLRPFYDLIILDKGDNPRWKTLLKRLFCNLEIMMSRYRIGDGTGASYIEGSHNCSQDSSYAYYLSVIQSGLNLKRKDYRKYLKPLLTLNLLRDDWKNQNIELGDHPSDEPIKLLKRTLLSLKTLWPRKAQEIFQDIFLKNAYGVVILGSGGYGKSQNEIIQIKPFR